jgi:hypothetical protein
MRPGRIYKTVEDRVFNRYIFERDYSMSRLIRVYQSQSKTYEAVKDLINRYSKQVL